MRVALIRSLGGKVAAFSGLLEQVATMRNKYWAALEAEAYCQTASEAEAAEAWTAEQRIALARAKAAAVDAINAAVRVWR